MVSAKTTMNRRAPFVELHQIRAKTPKPAMERVIVEAKPINQTAAHAEVTPIRSARTLIRA
jgi:hypothetical protein